MDGVAVPGQGPSCDWVWLYKAQGPHRELLTSRPPAAQQRDVLPPATHGALQERAKAAQRRNLLPLHLKPPSVDIVAPTPPTPTGGASIAHLLDVGPSTSRVPDMRVERRGCCPVLSQAIAVDDCIMLMYVLAWRTC